MNNTVRTVVGAVIGATLMLTSLASAHATEITNPVQPREDLGASVTGADGKTRTVIKTDTGDMSGRVDLQPGDTLNVSDDGKTVTGRDVTGNAFMILTVPQLKIGNKAVDAVFAVDGAEVSLVPSAGARQPRAACPQSWWGGFLVGVVGGSAVCIPAGLANVFAGAACTVGWGTMTNSINFDHACRNR